MPDDKPSNAPDELMPRDDLSAAAVLSDDDETPGGGGGMMGAGARTPASTGGTAPNAAIDVPTPQTDRDGAAEGESVARAAEEAPEPRPTSQ